MRHKEAQELEQLLDSFCDSDELFRLLELVERYKSETPYTTLAVPGQGLAPEQRDKLNELRKLDTLTVLRVLLSEKDNFNAMMKQQEATDGR